MINVFLYDSNKYKDYDESLFPESLRFYLKNNKKNKISYIAYNLLIRILTDYCKLKEIDFDFTSKPRLVSGEVNFNISHTGQYIAIGVSFGNKIGIDLESLDREVSDNLYERVLHEHEKMIRAEIYDKKTHFLNCYTRKEAHLKLQGTGFNIHPKNLNTYQLEYYPIYTFEKERLILCVAGATDLKININSYL